jgi:hypothetical protein
VFATAVAINSWRFVQPGPNHWQIVLTEMSADQNLQNITAETVDAFGEECVLP